jgi:hypothetical protein
MIKKICIVGSGPNAIATLKPFLNYSDKFDITLITTGDFEFNYNKQTNFINSLDIVEKHNYWLNQKKKFKGLVPKKLYFNKDEIYENPNQEFQLDNKISLDVSYKIGGLSNVWGANVCDLSQNDIEKFELNKQESCELHEISKQLKLTGERDIIDNQYKRLVYQEKKISHTSQAIKLKEIFEKKKEYFKKENFRVGFAKLAINTQDKINSCENCGLCMFGCHKNSIYNSKNELFKLKDNINFLQNSKITSLEEKDSIVELQILNEKKLQKNILNFDIVLLAAGTIDTSILALKFLEKYKKNNLEIKDSNKYFFLLFTNKKKLKDEHMKTIGLSQLFLQTEINNNTFHMQLYDSNVIFKMIFKKFFNNKFTNLIFNSLRFVLDRIMFGVIYFPSELSNSMKIEKNGKFFQIKKINFNSNISLKLFVKIFSIFFKLKSFLLPVLIKGKTGVSQHFGSSLPIRNNPIYGECDINGKLFGSKNIYVTDCSSLSRIPSTPTTALSMSNAMRISKAVIERELIK